MDQKHGILKIFSFATTGDVKNVFALRISHSPFADVFVIMAKDDEDIIRMFVVEKDTPGLEADKIENKFSLRCSITGTISMSDVKISANQMLPKSRGLSVCDTKFFFVFLVGKNCEWKFWIFIHDYFNNWLNNFKPTAFLNSFLPFLAKFLSKIQKMNAFLL